MSAPTFFPADVLTNLLSLESVLKNGEDPDELAVDGRRLALSLRQWEREWRAGNARLVVQCQPKPNREGGLSAPADFDDPEF